MSVIEDTRKVMQDFTAPELRELKARLEAQEKRFDQMDRQSDRIKSKFGDVEGRFDEVERRAAKRHENVLWTIVEMTDLNSMRECIARLASQAIPRQ